jgi:hypothetical protein
VQDNGDPRICDQCTFRPWAQEGLLDRAEVSVTAPPLGTQVTSASCTPAAAGGMSCVAHGVNPIGAAVIRVFDNNGETSGEVAVP